MRKHHFLILTVCTLIGLLAAGNSSSARQWLMSQTGQPDAPTVLPVSDCDLSAGACTYALTEGGSVTLDIQPRPIEPITALSVDVQVDGQAPVRVALDLSGTEMDMGFNQTPLTELSNGHFAGQTSIPVCTTGKMRWLASVQLELSDRRLSIPFQFEAGQAH